MEDFEDLKSVREVRHEKKEKAKKILPVKKSAQKEYIRDLLARHQDKFEEKLLELAEYDPKTYCQIIVSLTKHMIPKQTEVSVSHGLDEDFKQLMALGMTNVEDDATEADLEVVNAPKILDADYEELKDYTDGSIE